MRLNITTDTHESRSFVFFTQKFFLLFLSSAFALAVHNLRDLPPTHAYPTTERNTGRHQFFSTPTLPTPFSETSVMPRRESDTLNSI